MRFPRNTVLLSYMLHLYFFGTPKVSYANSPIDTLNRSHISMQLWAFLVMHHQQTHTRDRLATLFWPNLEADRTRRTLNNIVWRLRTALGEAEDRFIVTNATLQATLADADWLDITSFEQRTQAFMQSVSAEPPTQVIAQFESTLALYRGDFLEGFDDEWCLTWRVRERERYLQTLEHVVDYCQHHNELSYAFTTVQQLVNADPDRQSSYQRAIEIAMALDRQAEARTYFAAYQRQWTEELGLSLAPEMLKLAVQYDLHSPCTVYGNTNAKAVQAGIRSVLSLPVAHNHAHLQRQLEILIKSDELYDLMADRQRQSENLLLAQALADQLGDPTAQLDILARRAWVATHQGEYETSISLAQEGLRLVDTCHLPTQRAPFHRQLGIASEELGDFRSALHHYTKALTLDEAQNMNVYLPADLNNVAAVQLTLGYYCQGIQQLARTQALLSASPQPAILVKVLGNLGYGWMKLGLLQKAQHFFAQAHDVATQIGEYSANWWVTTLQAKLHHLLGDSNSATTLALQTYAAVNLNQCAGLLSYLADTLAWLYRDLADGEQALIWAQRAHLHATERGHWRYHVRGLMRLGQAQLLLQQNELALSTLTEAVKFYAGKGQHLEEEAELYFTYALCANALNHKAITVEAQQQAEAALGRQLAAVPELEWRQSFLAIQRFFTYYSPTSPPHTTH